MKRLFTLLVCSLLFLGSIQAQIDEYRKPIKFGFDLGIGYANQWGNAYDAYAKKGIFSFIFGVDLDINFGDKSFIEIGIDFTRKGCRYEGHEWLDDKGGPWALYNNDKTVTNLFYLQIPVMYGINLPIESEIAWKFMVGPYFGIGATGDRRSTYNSEQRMLINAREQEPSIVSSFSKDFQYGYRYFDVGARVQTGIEVGRVSYMVAYELGLFNVIQDQKYTNLKARNNGILGIVSFRF